MRSSGERMVALGGDAEKQQKRSSNANCQAVRARTPAYVFAYRRAPNIAGCASCIILKCRPENDAKSAKRTGRPNAGSRKGRPFLQLKQAYPP